MVDKNTAKLHKKSYWLFVFDCILIIFCNILSIAVTKLYFFYKKKGS